MKEKLVDIVWGDSKMIVIPITPENKIKRARKLAESALDGTLNFDYGTIKKKRSALYAYYETELRDLEWQRMHHVDEDTAWQWTAKMRGVREKRNKAVYRNEYEYNRRRRAYDNLHDALTLLVDEGEIESFTLRPDGYLMVTWFTGYEKTEIQIIEPGLGYNTPKLPIGELSNKIHVASLDIKHKQGIVPFVAPDNTGAGDLLPTKLSDRDRDREMFKSLNKGRYEAGAEWRNKERLKRGEKIQLW